MLLFGGHMELCCPYIEIAGVGNSSYAKVRFLRYFRAIRGPTALKLVVIIAVLATFHFVETNGIPIDEEVGSESTGKETRTALVGILIQLILRFKVISFYKTVRFFVRCKGMNGYAPCETTEVLLYFALSFYVIILWFHRVFIDCVKVHVEPLAVTDVA